MFGLLKICFYLFLIFWEFLSTIGIDFPSLIKFVLYASMPFCSKYISIPNVVKCCSFYKNYNCLEIKIKRYEFGELVMFCSEVRFDRSLDMDNFCFLYYYQVLLLLGVLLISNLKQENLLI